MIFRRRQSVFFYDFCNEICHIRSCNVHAGNVYRNRNCNSKFFFPAFDLFCAFFPHVTVKLCYKSVFFKKWNKEIRTNKTKFRMNPSYKSLAAAEHWLFTLDIKLWLIVYLELLLFNGCFKVL